MLLNEHRSFMSSLYQCTQQYYRAAPALIHLVLVGH